MNASAFGVPSALGALVSIPTQREHVPEDHPEFHVWAFTDCPRKLLKAYAHSCHTDAAAAIASGDAPRQVSAVADLAAIHGQLSWWSE